MVTVLAAADAVNAVGMCDVFVTEAACRIDDTPISNPLHCSRNTTGTYRLQQLQQLLLCCMLSPTLIAIPDPVTYSNSDTRSVREIQMD